MIYNQLRHDIISNFINYFSSDDKIREQMSKCLDDYIRYDHEDFKIVETWCTYDVDFIAESEGLKLSHEEKCKVLESIDKYHDAEAGICWDTIRYFVNKVKNESNETN